MPNYTGDLARYVLDRLFDNLTDKSYWNVDDWNNVDLLRIIARGSNLKCQLTIGVFSIAFAMSVIEKVGEFLNTLTMQYELRYKWWINVIVMILSVPHCLCWLFYFQNSITFLFEKLTCAVEILIWSDAVDFLTKSPEMPYSVVTAQQACSTEMVKLKLVCLSWSGTSYRAKSGICDSRTCLITLTPKRGAMVMHSDFCLSNTIALVDLIFYTRSIIPVALSSSKAGHRSTLAFLRSCVIAATRRRKHTQVELLWITRRIRTIAVLPSNSAF